MDLLKEYLPRLVKSKVFLIQTALLVILVIVLFTFSTNLIYAYQQAEQNQQEINNIESFLQKFSEQKKFLENIEERPVKAEELDDIQTELFKQIRRYKLNLVKFNARGATTKEKKQTREYEMTVQGDYIAVMEFLDDFHARNALINIRYLDLHQQQGKIMAEIVYSVYVQ